VISASQMQPLFKFMEGCERGVGFDMGVFCWFGGAMSVHPEAGKSGLLRTFHVESQVVSHVSDLRGRECECLAGCMKHRRIWLGATNFMRGE